MKILVLTSSTGGGHNTRARALKAWAEPKHEVVIHKPLEMGHGVYRFGVALYNNIQKIYPRLHHLYYNYLEVAGMCASKDRILNPIAFINALDEHKPDVVVSVHGTLNHGFFDWVKIWNPRVPCVTYCGELYGGYGFSRHWVNPSADCFMGAVAETCQQALRLGMPAEKVMQAGFLLDPRFWEEPKKTRAQLLSRAELDPQRFTLLLSTSAMGANNHPELLRELHASGLELQVVALCRKERDVKAVRECLPSKSSVVVRALPYTYEMPDWIRAVDALVARPGTGTTCEALLSECPLIHNGIGGVMPQERITRKFCHQHDCVPIIKKPSDLTVLMNHWLKQDEVYHKIKNNLHKAHPTEHPMQIVQKLESLVT